MSQLVRSAAVALARVAVPRASGLHAASFALAPVSLLLQHPRRGMAVSGKYNRRTPTSGNAVVARASNEVSTAISGVSLEGDEAQLAQLRLKPGIAFKVDPSSIISVPQGVEVRACYGAPQPQLQRQQEPAGGGGFMSRLRNAPPPQQQQTPSAPMLAELVLQQGHSTPEEAIELGPTTASKLHTLSLDDYGGEMYIARGAFLAAPSSVNIHSVDEPTGIPGLVLQRIDGSGNVILKVAGQALPKQLGPGEQLYAQASRLVAVESTVQVLGGADGLLVTLVGPGRVLLQSLPSLEVALSQQAEATASVLQANGMNPASAGPAAGGFAMGPMSGMGGGLGSMVMQGMAFGAGSAIAHGAINSMMGGGHGAAAAPAPEPEPVAEEQSGDSGDGGGWFGGGDDGGDDGGFDGGDGDW